MDKSQAEEEFQMNIYYQSEERFFRGIFMLWSCFDISNEVINDIRFGCRE